MLLLASAALYGQTGTTTAQPAAPESAITDKDRLEIQKLATKYVSLEVQMLRVQAEYQRKLQVLTEACIKAGGALAPGEDLVCAAPDPVSKKEDSSK